MLQVETIGPVQRLRLGRSLGGRGLYFTAAYRVGELLVDSGCAHTAHELAGALAREGPAPRILLNTHSHEDHIGGNALLQERFGVSALAHPQTLQVAAAPRQRQPQQLYRRLFWGYPSPSGGSAIGTMVEAPGLRLQVIPTPGHSPDHLAFFEPDRGWLFCGDAFVGGQDRELRGQADAWQIVASLRKLSGLGAELLFPGSGTVYRNPRTALQRKIQYLEELGGRILELQQRGLSPRRIRRILFGRERAIAWITGGDFTSLHLVLSFLGQGGQDLDGRLAVP